MVLKYFIHALLTDLSDKCYLVFEAALGGEVFDRVRAKGNGLTEPEAAHVVKSMGSALEHLHSHGFVHRDVVPENIMYLSSPEENPHTRIVLVDFGLTKYLGYEGEKLRQMAGSMGYIAPEVVAEDP